MLNPQFDPLPDSQSPSVLEGSNAMDKVASHLDACASTVLKIPHAMDQIIGMGDETLYVETEDTSFVVAENEPPGTATVTTPSRSINGYIVCGNIIDKTVSCLCYPPGINCF